MADQASREAAALYEAAVEQSRQRVMEPPIQEKDMVVRTQMKSGDKKSRPSPAVGLNRLLQNMTTEQLVQGIVLSEVLGKPVSLRKGPRK